MAMRLFILGTEARHYHIRSEIPDDPYDVSKNFVVTPDVHCFVGRLRKTEIDRSCEELPGMYNGISADFSAMERDAKVSV